MPADRVMWFPRGFLPPYVGFCPSKKAWDREMRRLRVAGQRYPAADGQCSVFENTNGGKTVILMTIGEHMDAKDDPVGVIGLLVHECIHAWRFILTDIGEATPSSEFEAYSVQGLVIHALQAYADSGRFKAFRSAAPSE